ncbi:MAG: enoyl-CoA hydratase/isomerase family protein [Leptospiraceae bacterium]|nr:enoyl-CoA hydratase/isomerase family protein [Leptospiraceae bacterium]MCB1306147.1 enoyl-CoA hydratase/isomerase family protein [Leptospiraceae bacterium]
MSDTVEIELQDDGQIAILYLNNPDTKNSMTLEMGLSFHRELHRLAGRNPAPRALIVTGKNGLFSSGGDLGLLRSFMEKSQKDNQEFMESFYRLFLEVRYMPFPVLAAVNGHAIGASLALALACDLRYFVPDGKYAFNFVRIGIHPGMGSSFLARSVAGLHQAQELLFTGRQISGTEALQRGLCHGLADKGQILNHVMDVAREIAEAAPQAVRALKQGLYANRNLEDTLRYEAESQAENYLSQDFREAMEAIQQKRKPAYQDK